MPWAKSIPIELTDDEKTKLESIVRKATSQQRDVFRARIILEAAQGASNRTIAQKLDSDRVTVRTWRKRFFKQRLEGLQDHPRSGRPLTFSLRRAASNRRSGHKTG